MSVSYALALSMTRTAEIKIRDPIQPGGFKMRAACKYVGGISEITMRRLIAAKKIKPNRKLRHLLFAKSELDRWLNE